MKDIEILEAFIERDLQMHEDYGVKATIEDKEIQAVNNIIIEFKRTLKQNQAYKDRINILRDRVQENERTIKDLTNTFVREKQNYENDIDILMNKIDEYEINTVWKYAVKEEYIPKSLVKEKIIQDKANLNKSVNANLKKAYKARIEFGQELLGEKP